MWHRAKFDLNFLGLALSGAAGSTVGHVATPEIEMAHDTGGGA